MMNRKAPIVWDYLISVKAVGKTNTVSQEQVREALGFTDSRDIRREVRYERGTLGKPIGSKFGKGGGYFIPANDSEILELKRRFEKKFVSAADAVRPFRKLVSQMEKGSKGVVSVKEDGNGSDKG